MFIYLLINSVGRYRTMALSFPLPPPVLEWFEANGWHVQSNELKSDVEAR